MCNFGRALRDAWYLDPDITYLNHGTVGATPRAVLAEQMRLMEEIERQPARFMLRELADPKLARPERTHRLRVAAEAIAPFVGVPNGDQLLFVDNITAGANAVLRSFPFDPSDEILVTSLGYGGIINAARFAASERGCSLRSIDLPGPGTPPHVFVETIEAALTANSRLLVVDHLTAQTALVLPLREIADACHRNGTLVLADGAHVPGNIALDITSLGVDWYAANLHKWAWAPRSSGVLWAAPEHRTVLHPAVISWGLDNGPIAEFDLLGTRDPTAHLTAPFAIELMHSYGVEEVFRHNHDLAWWSGHYLAERWGTPFSTPESMIGSMVTVRLPDRFSGDSESAIALQSELERRGIEIPIHADRGGFTARISAQVYCDRSDIEHFAETIDAI